jgi:NarL family two-component system response regulator LiaR
VATRLAAVKQAARSEPREREPSSDRLTLIVADPDPLARRVVRESLQAGKGFVVAAEAKDGVEAVELAVHYRPKLVLMEVGLPRIDGIDACRQIVLSAPEVRVVIFSVGQEREVQIRALKAGANGYLSKNASISSVMQALRAVARGEAAISRHVTLHLIEVLRCTSDNGLGMRPVKSVLTGREWEVLDLICAGATTREISEVLFLSEDTVYSHSKNILRKLGVHSRSEAVAKAERMRRPEPSRQDGTRAASTGERSSIHATGTSC